MTGSIRACLMPDLSLSEINALCTKAARGAGYSWGMAQEAGFAAKWLCLRNVAGADHVACLLEQLKGEDPRTLAPAPEDGALSVPGGRVCSLALGCLISDRPDLVLGQASLTCPGVVQPVLLLPFLAGLAEGSTQVELTFDETGILVQCGSVISDKPLPAGNCVTAISIRKSADAQMRADVVREQPHLSVSEPSFELLNEFADKTYVPESALSRERGAGGAD